MQNSSKIKSAFLFSAIGEYSTQILGFISIVIVARILSPDEIGLYAVAGTASILATELSSFGVVQYLIREKDIPEEKIRSVLGMSVMITWSLGILLILSAPYIATFYDKPDIKNILWILSISFFIVPFFGVPFALWKRRLQFHKVAFLNFSAQLVTTVSVIVLVLLDFSYYGLAIGQIIGIFSRLVIILLTKPEGTVWMPKFTLLRGLVKFGFFASLTNVFARFTESVPDLVIGKIGTMADVGHFSRGFGAILFLNKILISAVSPVVLPHLSEVKRSGQSVVDAYLHSMNLVLAFTLPVFAVAGAAAYPMIMALFGDQWVEAVVITSILSIWVMFVSVHSFSGSAFIVSGAEQLMFRSELITSVFRLVAAILTAPHGIEMVAWAMVASGVLDLCVKTMYLKQCMGLMVNRMVPVILPNMLIGFVCWLAAKLIDYIVVFEEANPFQSIAIIALIMPIVWLLLLRITKHKAWYLIWDISGKIFRKVQAKRSGISQ